MQSWEEKYLDLVEEIVRKGNDRPDRTGVGTRALFAKTLDIDLTAGFPAVTTKKLAWKAVVSELLWFIEGSGDERRLAEILHGTRDSERKTIWSANAEADYWAPKAQFKGDLGRVYGVQWRHWKKFTPTTAPYDGGGVQAAPDHFKVSEVDQLAQLINTLKTNPTDRRMIISAWNVGELDQMALPPCHMLAQFFVMGKHLSCQMYQRSVDVMLGLPFNIASYALLTHLVAQATGLVPQRLVLNLGDVHIYQNHITGAHEQLLRRPFNPPKLEVNPDILDINKFTMKDISLVKYKHHEPIKMDMAV